MDLRRTELLQEAYLSLVEENRGKEMLSESEVEPPVEAKTKLARLMGGGAKEKMQPKVAGAWGRGLDNMVSF